MKDWIYRCMMVCLMGVSTAAWAQDQMAQDQTGDAMLETVSSAIREIAPEGTEVQLTTSSEIASSEHVGEDATKQSHQATTPQGSDGQPLPPRRKRELKNREFDDCEKIRLLICAHCDFPSKEDFLLTSADPETCIKTIIEDETVLISVRERALTALAYFDSSANRASLKQTLEHAGTSDNRLFVLYAIVAYSNIAKEESVPLIEKFMHHEDDFVRLTAIRRLGQTPGIEAYSALKKQYQVEENRFFRQKLEDALAEHCQRNKSFCS